MSTSKKSIHNSFWALSCQQKSTKGSHEKSWLLFRAGKEIFAEALQISKAGAYNLLNSPDFPTLRIGGRKLVMKNELLEWLKSRTNRKV